MLKTCHVCKHLKTSKHPANIDQVTPVSSTFTRKITEEPQKLGDSAGAAADIALAKTVNANIQSEFEGADIGNN